MKPTNYTSEWSAAVERSERFGLTVPPHDVEPDTRFLNARRIAEFPYVVRRRLGDVGPSDVMAQCLSLNYRLLPVMADWFGCAVLYTLGWIDDGTERGIFKFDDAFIADKLRNGHKPGKVNIHAWLTLPSMEIIDVTLATTFAITHGRPSKEVEFSWATPTASKVSPIGRCLSGRTFCEGSVCWLNSRCRESTANPCHA